MVKVLSIDAGRHKEVDIPASDAVTNVTGLMEQRAIVSVVDDGEVKTITYDDVGTYLTNYTRTITKLNGVLQTIVNQCDYAGSTYTFTKTATDGGIPFALTTNIS